jgi:hypothetical protein
MVIRQQMMKSLPMAIALLVTAAPPFTTPATPRQGVVDLVELMKEFEQANS